MTGIARYTRISQYGPDPGTSDLAYRLGIGQLDPATQVGLGPTFQNRQQEGRQRREDESAINAGNARKAADAAASAAAVDMDNQRFKTGRRAGRASTILAGGALGDTGFGGSARRALLGA